MDKITGIYCFENLIDGKRYTGQSEDIDDRKKDHLYLLKSEKCNDSKYFQNAWNFYGEENFKFWIVEECPIELLDKREIFWIKELRSHVSDKGYNISWGGNAPMRGRNHTEETIKKLSGKNNPMWGIPRTPDQKKKQSERMMGENNPNFGKPIPEDQKKKISEKMIGKHKGKDSYMWGVPKSPEQKKKQSERMMGENNPSFGKPWNEERIEKNSKNRLGKKILKNSSSQYVGVSFYKLSNKWRSRISWKGKVILIGMFDFELDAALAYNAKALELYGSDAKLNIIE